MQMKAMLCVQPSKGWTNITQFYNQAERGTNNSSSKNKERLYHQVIYS